MSKSEFHPTQRQPVTIIHDGRTDMPTFLEIQPCATDTDILATLSDIGLPAQGILGYLESRLDLYPLKCCILRPSDFPHAVELPPWPKDLENFIYPVGFPDPSSHQCDLMLHHNATDFDLLEVGQLIFGKKFTGVSTLDNPGHWFAESDWTSITVAYDADYFPDLLTLKQTNTQPS
jgi:hypothetical protein